MNAIIASTPERFHTADYGAYRWDPLMVEKPGTWILISTSCSFDHFRGVQRPHVSCVVDDFGDLVRVQ